MSILISEGIICYLLSHLALSNLNIYTCYADHGIGVILKRPNRNLLKIDNLNFSKLKFEDYFYNYKKYMNLINYEELIKIIKEY